MSDLNTRKKKCEQLGMDAGTAAHRLRKLMLFQLVQETNKDICYKCSLKIETVDELSIEHKVPWLDSSMPKELFFDLNNVAFSHLTCNIADARKPNKKYFTDEQRAEAKRKYWREGQKRIYSPDKRREKFLRSGH
jgi:hypothetical protein